MFQVNECKLYGLWNLSSSEEEKQALISADRLKLLQNHDLLAINFLYQNYRKNYKGAILNEQNGLDMQFQVSIFLNVMLGYVEQKFLILVLSPDYLIAKWNQFLTNIAGLKTITVCSNTCPEEFDDQHGVALLISFNDINLLEHIIDYNYFAVIIDCFDEVAKKLIIKRAYGDFHIGLTARNFYFNPDQSLQWIMLNWCSPGCCGESKNFWKIDNDNFANFRDNYRHWWFRLTGHFCDSLKDVVKKEESIQFKPATKKLTRNRKRNGKKPIDKKESNKNIKPEAEYMETSSFEIEEKTDLVEHAKSEINNTSLDLKDLNDESTRFKAAIPKIDDDDDDPINLLLSTSDNHSLQMETSSDLNQCDWEKILDKATPLEEMSFKEDIALETNIKKANLNDDHDNVLLALLDDEGSYKGRHNSIGPESEISLKKEELSTQIFSEVPSTSQIVEKEDSTDFFKFLID